MAFRNLLFDRLPQVLHKHFGTVHESVIYDGAVLVPSGLASDCRELAETVLSEEAALTVVFSIEDLARDIESIIITTVREGTNGTAKLIDQLCNRLEKRDEWKLVLIPLQGIKLSEPATEIGGFRLRKMDDDAIGEAISLMNAAIDRTTNTSDQKAAAKEFFANELKTELSGSVCLEVRVCSDTIKAENTAVQKASVLIDLLRYGSSGLYRKAVNPGVGFKGDAKPGVYRRYILPLGASAATHNVFTTPPYGELFLDASALQIMRKLGVQRLATALEGPMSAFESALSRSVHWFAESRMQLKPEYEVVTLAVAIESALAVPGKEGHGRNDLSEAVAVLLSDSPPHRKDLYDLTRAALRQRGDVVHQGTDAAEWDGLNAFRSVVQQFLAAAIRSTERFKTSAELLTWIASRKAGLVKGR